MESEKPQGGDINTEPPKSYYTIVAPGTIQADLDYAVTVTLHKHTGPITVQITLSGPSCNENRTLELQPQSSQMAIFKVPSQLADGTYELIVEGTQGLVFRESSKLIFRNCLHQIYIQTDKATYKPGDLVLYRLLALDRNLKPANFSDPVDLVIRDGASNQIKQVKDLKFNKGVYRGEFQLSDQPVLGKWSIDVNAGRDSLMKLGKSFEVAKYVLPKFSVEIETEREIAILDKQIKVTVLSNYTYGQPVRGKLQVIAKLKQYCQLLGCAEKTIDFNGKADVEFDFMEDLGLQHPTEDEYGDWQIHLKAVVLEAFTDIQQSSTTEVNLRRSRYKITLLDYRPEYELNKPFEIRAAVKYLNNRPVTNAKRPVQLIISQDYVTNFQAKDHDLFFQSEINPDGIVVFTVTIAEDKDYSWMTFRFEEEVQSEYGLYLKPAAAAAASDEVTSTETYELPLELNLQTETPQLGEELLIEVKSNAPLLNFVYFIIARGKIVQHKMVNLSGTSKCYSLQVMATFDMVPVAYVFAYLIDQAGEFHHCHVVIRFEKVFQNPLNIIPSLEETKPGAELTLSIETDPESLVGLMAVDQSVLLLQSGNDFNDVHIYHGLIIYESRLHVEDVWAMPYPGKRCGLVALTNAFQKKPKRKIRCRAMKCKESVARQDMEFAEDELRDRERSLDEDTCIAPVRKNFVETWIFDDIECASGRTAFTKTIPDTITSWIITGFSINEKTGFGMTDEATKVRVFQPFFVSTNLPYSIKRGEVVSIPIVVFNYTAGDLQAVVTMENDLNEYDFMEDTNNAQMLSKKILIPSNGSETVNFKIKPKIVGEVMLKIKAITPLAGDVVHQKLNVEPEGVTQHKNVAHFINLSEQGQTTEHILKAIIPQDRVDDSEYLEFTVVGDILGPTIKNIDQLIRMPYGCGEQNMMNFVPNILVVKYLNAIGRDMPGLMEKAKKYMETGYQKELTYKHGNGAFSTFGEGSSEANSWLTAYVARSFIQARNLITIDEKIIEDALQYLLGTQKDNGQFPQTGELFHSSNQNELGVSAFILMAFLEDKVYALKYATAVERSLQYLANNVQTEDNIYSLALILFVFQKTKHPLTNQVNEKIQQKSKFENNLKWWSNSTEYNNNNIEVTSYILQSMLEMEAQQLGDIVPIIKWLISQRNNLGGFDSTQDTVVGLKALVAFAEKFSSTGGDGGENLKIHYKGLDEAGVETTLGSFAVDRENSFILQSYLLPKSTRQLSLTASGQKGASALLQLSYQYNVNVPEQEPNFHIEYTAKTTPVPGQFAMNVSVEYKPHYSVEAKESNMAVMEISLPSGYITHIDNLAAIQNDPRVQRVETKNDDTIIVIYFERLVVGEQSSFDIFANKSHAVDNLKPSPITIYDYYNTNQRATVLYQK
ncbi:CD109 antigen [Musca domestica]|uniref:CD109 antigen n=1 Tax=Musca domestica TaxID=7370 RepID=A0ABM3V473_MUSDO|nr:CD109 antigen [Musca domestica]